MRHLSASPNPPRVFLDASVLIAGSASFTGASRAVLILGELRLLKLVVCPHVLQEAERNLVKKLPEALADYRTLLAHLPLETISDPAPEALLPWLDIVAAKDAPIVVAAKSAGVQRLVTLDAQHLTGKPDLARAAGLLICRPGELIEEIRTAIALGLWVSPPAPE